MLVLQLNMEYNTMMNRFNTIDEIEAEYNQMHVTKRKLDIFFDMFLEKFDSKLSGDKKTNPYWKLYNDKFNEYEEIQRGINYAKYLLRQKGRNV